ncbi:hypothetical protein EBB07_24325 [Paenibacillaceae bacterium]|nr:hypothetical protein EBB07_24325 [Paenibacillaceae bacterium]
MKKTSSSTISFQSGDQELDRGFAWAKEQALFYAHNGGDPVGLWYEGALPGREAFCMRDIAHQSLGAAVLGLQEHTRNMMRRFAANISESKDYCTYWEITGDNVPAPVDYDSDEDFWYNLPANFDVIDACYRQYLWTGDRSYLDEAVFQNFYDLSVTKFVERWDKDGDGIPEYEPSYGRRGLASYNEAGQHPRIGADLIAIMIAGYEAYAGIAKVKGQQKLYAEYSAKSATLRQLFETSWWDEANGQFFAALGQDGKFVSAGGEGQFLPLYYGAVEDQAKREAALRETLAQGASNVEGMSYLPEAYYRNGKEREAFSSLKALLDPALERREYPEVSYAAVGAIISGLMGISADGLSGITTVSGLAEELDWAEVAHLPVLGGEITVKHNGNFHTEFSNLSGEAVRWRAKFRKDAALPEIVYHNGQAVPAGTEQDKLGRDYLVAEAVVAPGETHVLTVVHAAASEG